MNGQILFEVVGALVVMLLCGIAAVVISHHQAVERQRRALRRQREIHQARRAAERRIYAHYQQAAWAATQHMIRRYR